VLRTTTHEPLSGSVVGQPLLQRHNVGRGVADLVQPGLDTLTVVSSLLLLLAQCLDVLVEM